VEMGHCERLEVPASPRLINNYRGSKPTNQVNCHLD